jgi:hypothetical protein
MNTQIDTYEELVCFLLSFRKSAEGLFNAWIKARDINSRGGKYNYTFCFMNQCKTFSACEIIQLEAASRCPSLNDLLGNTQTIEGIAILLFKIRIPLMGLYSSLYSCNGFKGNGK